MTRLVEDELMNEQLGSNHDLTTQALIVTLRASQRPCTRVRCLLSSFFCLPVRQLGKQTQPYSPSCLDVNVSV